MSIKNVKLILNQNINHLGSEGDIVHVSKGYARNYLLPSGIAEPITLAKIKYFDKLEKERKQNKKQERQKAEEAKEYLESIKKFTIKRKISSNDTIFGSVGERDIVEVINQTTGLNVQKYQLNLPELKTVGMHEIEINLMDDITVTIQLQILPETS
uniref:Large ribosomal subunit protein bL9c n=1 Tax=Scinaia undulata TaxID=1884664 RepID=A0A1G4NXQ2_9FLOR|nr:Ribosomal protein L9 [Scinaia undulata]SCW23473.1 Ribosomal protein L9 [Scinaia undulata]